MFAKLLTLAVFVCLASAANGQGKKSGPAAARKPVIFAVTSGGKTIEPIATVEKGRLIEISVSGEEQGPFAKKYYRAGSTYELIFGGAASGTVSVTKAMYPGECSANSAETATPAPSATLSQSVMALAAEKGFKLSVKGTRRRPTAAERTAVEMLVRSEYLKNKVSADHLKVLRYQNLTAVDVDGDGKPEFVGSYWIQAGEKERDLLFFIIRTGASGDLSFGYSNFSRVTPDDVMSGDLNDMDGGVGHELLLDVMDYDGDGTAEIFTIARGFEGDGFYAYKLGKDKWTRVFETSNYRCAF